MAYTQPYYGYYPQYNNGATPDMLNQFKGQYQPQMQMPQQPLQQNSTPPQIPIITGGLIYVDNEEQAKNYLVAPNNAVPMFDKNKPLMYVKASDGAGMPNFKKYTISEYEENNNLVNAPKTPVEHTCKCGDKFISKEDFSAVEGKIQEVMCRLSAVEDNYNKLTAKSTSKPTKTIKKTEAE